MKTGLRIRGLAIVGLGVALALGLFGQAWAQYPPPGATVTLAAEDTTAALGADVTVTATVLDAEGNPAAGVECTFSIAAQPGTDATVDPGPVTTDAAGNASTTLHVGTTPGSIAIEVDCGGLSAQVSVVAGEAVGPTPAAPPASLPETGTGGGGGGPVWAFWLLIAAGTAIGIGGIAFAWRRIKA
jgi:hypothetical protein